MYKVYFDHRTIFLTTQFDKYYKKYDGLFVKYLNEIQLAYVMELFRNIKEIKNVFIIYHDIEKIFEEFKTFFNLVEAAGGLVYNSKGQVLMIKRRGKWDLPKGKKEMEENPGECAIREVQEECSTDTLDINDLLHITYHSYTQDGSMILKKTYWYKMFHEGESDLSPQTEEDITDVQWVDPEMLTEKLKNTYPSIVDVFRADELY